MEKLYTAGKDIYYMMVNKSNDMLVCNKNDSQNHRLVATELEAISFVTQTTNDDVKSR